ncbi:Alpha/Beta hydrolase protein [Elsinoe ampelina]|uniref:Alpha/Beta hydrolase protein n=1 Tax=Elsinoe ampelina TaxID=302913 RepID=A0A6A6G450_9PEZI|nr:Alpha/Beta hydrolase protein [Elsinoe ampelina]
MTSTSGPGHDVDEGIEEYRMHVSQRYLDLTRKKLELARLPKELSDDEDVDEDPHGVTKAQLEPLLDFWLDGFDFRAQEAHLNRQLPQYRTNLRWSRRVMSNQPQETLRVHFAHRRSTFKDAVPLLFVHDWGTSFVEVARIIEWLCEPVSTPTQMQSHPQAFHVVCPSIPGFGFGDPLQRHDAGIEDVAIVFQALMEKLGYKEYVAYGSGWGFRIVRSISYHSSACKAIYTTNPLVPAPTIRDTPLAYTQYRIAQMTGASIPFLSFGYVPSDFELPTSSDANTGSIPLNSSDNNTGLSTSALAFALSDSPTGLLAFMLNLINPPTAPSAPLQPSLSALPPRPLLGSVAGSNSASSSARLSAHSSAQGSARLSIPTGGLASNSSTALLPIPSSSRPSVSSSAQGSGSGTASVRASGSANIKDDAKAEPETKRNDSLHPNALLSPTSNPPPTSAPIAASPPAPRHLQPPSFSGQMASQSPPLTQPSQPISQPISQPTTQPTSQPLRDPERVDLFHPWTPSDILTWTMLYWLSGPEAPLRWLRNARRETSPSAPFWQERSKVPVGASFFRPPISTDSRQGEERRSEAGTDRVMGGRRARGDKREGRGSGVGVCPPIWMAAWGELSWLRRHETGREVKWPAWERGEVVVQDLRDFAGEVRREGGLGGM